MKKIFIISLFLVSCGHTVPVRVSTNDTTPVQSSLPIYSAQDIAKMNDSLNNWNIQLQHVAADIKQTRAEIETRQATFKNERGYKILRTPAEKQAKIKLDSLTVQNAQERLANLVSLQSTLTTAISSLTATIAGMKK